MSQMSTVNSAAPKARVPLFTAEAWAPLKVALFRSLWIATSIAQIGTWAREAAGPWLMHLLTTGWHTQPEMVAKVVEYSNLPICLFSVFAGALADVMDRRRLLIVTQIWMVVASALLGILTLFGLITPWGLLGLTFLLGMGTAAFGPALQAVLPELVPVKHFALAINMNSVALNVARAVGPGLFICVISFLHGKTGVGVTYLLTAISFISAVWVLWRWKRAPQRAAVHGEEVWDAIYAGWKYTVHSLANRAILLRVFLFIVPALVIWAQVPTIATRQLHLGEQSYAWLFAFIGMGAILGVFLMPGLHGRFSIDPVVNVCTSFFALGLIALSFVHTLWAAAPIMFFLGINWVIIPTNFNTATQKSVPPWVKGRAISFYLTVLFGSFAIGAKIWGIVTTNSSIHTSLLWGGISMLAALALAPLFPLTLNEGKDLSPGYPGPPSDELLGPRPQQSGPIKVCIQYKVPAHRAHGFTGLLHDLRLVRLRNGVRRWRMESIDEPDGNISFTETLAFSSWDAYARSFSRTTKWDVMLESLTQEYRTAKAPPALATREDLRRRRTAPTISHRAPAPANGEMNGDQPWMRQRINRSMDRVVDELFRAYDRIAGGGGSE